MHVELPLLLLLLLLLLQRAGNCPSIQVTLLPVSQMLPGVVLLQTLLKSLLVLPLLLLLHWVLLLPRLLHWLCLPLVCVLLIGMQLLALLVGCTLLPEEHGTAVQLRVMLLPLLLLGLLLLLLHIPCSSFVLTCCSVLLLLRHLARLERPPLLLVLLQGVAMHAVLLLLCVPLHVRILHVALLELQLVRHTCRVCERQVLLNALCLQGNKLLLPEVALLELLLLLLLLRLRLLHEAAIYSCSLVVHPCCCCCWREALPRKGAYRLALTASLSSRCITA
jgi:hypothetical protein